MIQPHIRINRRRALLRVAAGAAATASLGLRAQAEWPARPVRIVVPYAPGGSSDTLGRMIAKHLGESLKQTFVVENRAGAAGMVGSQHVARSAPDGYTWMLGPENMLTINPHLYRSTGFNVQDVFPVSLIGSLNQLLACHPKVGVSNLQDLVRVAKSRPLTYSSSGPGSIGQLAMEMLLEDLGVRMTHVPYRGPAPAVQDLIGGQVDCTFIVTAALVDHVRANRLTGIATTSQSRIPSLPELPTMKEVGLPKFEGNFWLGMFAPRGVPRAVLDRFGKALDETEFAQLPEAERTLGEVMAKYPGTDVARTADDRLRAIQLGRLR